MRVISGMRRGKKLAAPAGTETRPTLDRVKQIMFDTIQFEIEGKTVLDLFCGSGQLGVEALSRGAAVCYFNDSSAQALNVAKRNISDCGFEKNARVSCNLYTQCVTMLQRNSERPDIVFLDPPYHRGLIDAALQALIEGDCLAADAIVVCEHATDETVTVPADFAVIKDKKCGEVTLTILRAKAL